jgi:methylated-DNA-[protein]-cysteine S-methyltransferase
MQWTTYDSPLGELTLISRAGALSRLCFPEHAPHLPVHQRREMAFADTLRQLDEYFAGERTAFDVTLELDGTAFQRRVWRTLNEVPFGTTTTYGTIAEMLGIRRSQLAPSARAVATAIARTPVPIIIPCHRVIGADGSLRGYSGGLDRKQALLALELDRTGYVPTLDDNRRLALAA